ncbi:MAG TPA: extracellular solute-binding protein [Spirochaetia bacterium]|nr:extracellular solute-binding protein [Spirochaetia bacterium]HRZ64548.1 extracellular solute-binding protein [Spirochaetia bacterium]
MSKRIQALLAVLVIATSIAAAQGAKTTIRFFHRWPLEPRKSYFDALVAEFERRNPDIEIEMDSVINDAYKEKIRVLVSSNDIPDVFCSWSDSFAYNLVKSGRIKPLNDLLARDKAFAASFIQSQVKPFTFDGKVYGMPQTIDGKVFAYNKAIFAKAGITKEPKDFDELLATFATLKKKGYPTPIIEGLADPWTISHYLGTMFQRYLSPAVTAKDYNEATGEFTDPGYRVVLERFQKIVDFMGPNATSITHTDARALFAAGKLPVIYIQLAEFGLIRKSNPDIQYGYFNFPAFKDGKGDPGLLTGAPEGFMLSSTSKNPEAAERFFKFIYEKQNAAQFVKAVGAPVAVIGAMTPDNSFPELIGAVELINGVEGSAPWFDNAVNIKIADAFMRGAQAVATKDKTIDQVMAEVQAAAKIVRSEAKK